MPKMKPRAMIDKVPVWCAHDKIVDCAELIPNPKNPNTHPAKQIELLGKIILKQGWRLSITVSKRSGFIVKGHGRLEAALKAGIPRAPVDYQDYESEAVEHADLVADNRLAELSGLDHKALKDLLIEIDIEEIDLELTGFSLDVTAKLFELDPERELSDMIQQEEEVEIAKKTVENIENVISKHLNELAKHAPERLNQALAVVVSLKKGKGSREIFILADPNTRDTITELKRYADSGEKSPLECLLKSVFSFQK